MNRKIAQSEGDVNTTPARQIWQAENLSDHTRQLLIVMTMADVIKNALVTFLAARGARAALTEIVLSDQQKLSAYMRLA